MVAFLIVSVIALATPVKSANADDIIFGQPIMLTDTTTLVEIAASDNNVYVVREGGRSSGNLNAEIYFMASNDNGETFGPEINLSNIRGFSTGPQIAASDNNVYVVWEEALPVACGNSRLECYGPYDVYFRASNDNGATFGPTINLSNSVELSGGVLAISGNNVYVIYLEYGVGAFLRVSNDNGATFNPRISLGMGGNLHIATSGNNVYVLGDCSMVFRASTDNGSTFGEPIDLGNGLCNASLIASGSMVYLMWAQWNEDTRNVGISFTRSNDNGATFASPVYLGSSCANSNWVPNMVVSENNVYVAWHTCGNGGYDVLFTASNDNGATFGSMTNLSDNYGDSTSVGLAASGSNVYAFWNNRDPDYSIIASDIFFRASTNNGATFSDAVNISNDRGYSAGPGIALSDGYIHAIWLSDITGDFGYATFYTRSPPTANSPAPIPPSSNEPSTLKVNIDIKPNSDANNVNCINQKGAVSVGIFTEDGFDAQDVDASTLELQDVSAKKYVLKDLDGDGDLDGVARFKKADVCESGEILSSGLSIRVTLTGLTDDDKQFQGNDIIRFRR
jgi:hypothetical protein